MIITRKSLAQVTEMCLELKEQVEKDFKNYTLVASPLWDFPTDPNRCLNGISIEWYSKN